MNKKYETMAKFNMSMVRYFADKCGTVGLFDTYDSYFRPLDFSESDLNLWKLIAAFSGDNAFENFRIVSERYATERVNNYSAYQLEKYKTPVLMFKRINNNNCDWQMLMQITTPALLCQYIDGVKYAYGLSAHGTPFQLGVLNTRDDFDCFKRRYTEIEKQAESNFKELERYKLLKKKYEEKIRLMRMSDDF
ncbi:MAG: hypothetical protein J6V44_15955 [Methanobrevibacter sp.]|nr:hypothetical protein [Methanobrevibacter sp.]